jgi:uncharacterized protein (TIGR02466 family)
MSAALQLANVFETPVILDMVPDASALNEAFKTAVRARRESDPGVKKSNWNGWQSDADMLSWGGRPAAQLAEHFLKLCNNFTAFSSTDFTWSVEMWANLSSAGSANEAHIHPGAVWSSVYYVEDGYAGSSEPDLGGELVLYDPRMPFIRMLPFELRYRKPDGTAAETQVSIRPVAGQIVMFPPWLYHSVHPFSGAGTRISIAMNATVTK